MAYQAYEQFIRSAGKFPRWTNLRRRPTESNAGRILRSIFEEHENVDKAIEAYKKEFFLKNYEGKEDDILACLYIAQVGTIETLDEFVLTDPVYAVTDEEAVFYADDGYAFYQNGFIALYETNEANTLHYMYRGAPYTAELVYTPVWNIFDEFAWWCGLERFDGEENATLAQRCLNQLHYSEDPETDHRPNSTETGLRNTILNAVGAYMPVSAGDVNFLKPDETVLSHRNENGVTIYEELAQVNRDLARTRKWDIDYWDNAFRKLRYLPHVWDADVDVYQDGVGYRDALKITTLRETNQSGTTSVELFGYKYADAKVDAYIREHDIRDDVELSLTKYHNTLIPQTVPFKVTAEDLVPIEDPGHVLFRFYRQYTGTREYPLDRFVTGYGSDVTAYRNNGLANNKAYTLTIGSRDDKGERLEISRCERVLADGTRMNLLAADPDNGFDFAGGRLVNTTVLFHGTKLADFSDPQNLTNSQKTDTGFLMANPMGEASFTVGVRDWGTRNPRPLINIDIDETTGWNDITTYNTYIRNHGFSYDASLKRYVSQTDRTMAETFEISFATGECRKVRFNVCPVSPTTTTAKVNVIVSIDGEVIEQRPSWYQKPLGHTQNIFTFDLPEYAADQSMQHTVSIVVQRANPDAIYVSAIQLQSYEILFRTSAQSADSAPIRYTGSTQLPAILEGGYLTCIIRGHGNPVSPLIRSFHIGPYQANKVYRVSIPANTQASELEIETNGVALLYTAAGSKIDGFDTHYTYRCGTDGIRREIILDLSDFTTVYESDVVLQRTTRGGTNEYYFVLEPGQEKATIRINGVGEHLDRMLSLADILSIAPGSQKTVYCGRTLEGLLIAPEYIPYKIPYDDIHYGDRIEIVSPGDIPLRGQFVGHTERKDTESYTGAFREMYLYDPGARQYIAYGSKKIVQRITAGIPIDTLLYSPTPSANAFLGYHIETLAEAGTEIYFEKRNGVPVLWSIDPSATLTVESALFDDLPQQAVSVFSSDSFVTAQSVRLSNAIDLQDFMDGLDKPVELARYMISPPDTMEIAYENAVYTQLSDEDNRQLYVETDGFNKLYHSNILEITSITVGGTTYTGSSIPTILTLMQEPGILCWTETGLRTLQGRPITRIVYTYKNPVALHYKNVRDLYQKSGYTFEAVDEVNVPGISYRVHLLEAGDSFPIDYDYFMEKPDTVVAKCSNECYYASVEGDTVRILPVAEDTAPVIHNGFYYVGGREHYFFAYPRNQNVDKFEGLTIDNAENRDGALCLYEQAVNYLENSRMECTAMNIHAVIDFSRPHARTNIDPLGHVGACESYAAWQDYGVSRNLVVYKNGYATRFTMQPEGYALLDITRYLKGHTTVSCLYTGSLTIKLAREIRILDQQALKTVFCEPVGTFTSYQDIAYCTDASLQPDQYRYYLVIQGNGVLDEILVHDLTDPDAIAAHHQKAIDQLGFSVTEQNTVAQTTVDLEYTPDFMSYNHLETGRDGTLRVGTTVDWNITKVASFLPEDVRKERFLARNNALIAQAAGAYLETDPIAVQYRQSILHGAVSVNQLVKEPFAAFTIVVYAAPDKAGPWHEIAREKRANLATFSVGHMDRYLKFRVEAVENQVFVGMDLFYTYREVAAEDLTIYSYDEGSAVTKVFHIGAAGNYKLTRVLCDEGKDRYEGIYIRGAKKSGDEFIWTTWKNTADRPEFYEYELFQFKIHMKGTDARLRIKAFEFEVL